MLDAYPALPPAADVGRGEVGGSPWNLENHPPDVGEP